MRRRRRASPPLPAAHEVQEFGPHQRPPRLVRVARERRRVGTPARSAAGKRQNETPAVWPASREKLHRDRSGVFPLRGCLKTPGAPGREVLVACGSGAVNDAEAIVEGTSTLDGNGLGKAAGGDSELVEEADAAEEDEPIAVPIRDESDWACHSMYTRPRRRAGAVAGRSSCTERRPDHLRRVVSPSWSPGQRRAGRQAGHWPRPHRRRYRPDRSAGM